MSEELVELDCLFCGDRFKVKQNWCLEWELHDLEGNPCDNYHSKRARVFLSNSAQDPRPRLICAECCKTIYLLGREEVER